MPAINLTGLYPQAYEHPEDAAALNALKHTAGLDTLVRKVSGWGIERMLRIQNTGSFLHVTPDAFPDLYHLMITARDRLALPITPELYIRNEADINAFTAGVEKPIIVVNSGAIDFLEEDEMLFLLAHEMGHIKSGHVLYYQIASYFPLIGTIVGDLTLGVGSFLSLGLQAAILHWQRTSELTADRAGLLACQDQGTVLRAMMKLAGMPQKYAAKSDVKHFVQQARRFEALDVSTLDKVAKYLSIYGSTHPWTVMRAKELLTWIEDGGYDAVLRLPAGDLPQLPPVRRFCSHCGTEATAEDAFCTKCGHLSRRPVLSSTEPLERWSSVLSSGHSDCPESTNPPCSGSALDPNLHASVPGLTFVGVVRSNWKIGTEAANDSRPDTTLLELLLDVGGAILRQRQVLGNIPNIVGKSEEQDVIARVLHRCDKVDNTLNVDNGVIFQDVLTTLKVKIVR